MAKGSSQPGSTLMLDEYFSSGDDRFVQELRNISAPKKLASVVDRWKAEPRPWARRQIIEYLGQPLDCPGHEVVVKRLFKHAEAAGDDELMAAFMAAFDRLVRRVRRRRRRYDYQDRRIIEREELVLPWDRKPLFRPARGGMNPQTGDAIQIPAKVYRPGSGRLFSYRTRYYLRRRAWRYFRRLGYQRPLDYADAVARFLRLFTDEDLAAGENLLDSWGLMHACFHNSLVVRFTTQRVNLAEGRTLAELQPAPCHLPLWQREPAMDTLIDLICTARARAVRAWAMQLLRDAHGERLSNMRPEDLVRMLDCEDDEVQQFAAELLDRMPNLERLGLETWFKLLGTKHPTALAAICDAMVRHVSPDRLNLVQCVDVAVMSPVPVARLGLEFLRQRTIATDADRRELARLAGAGCNAIAAELAAWALGHVGMAGHYDREAVSGFFDALVAETRDGAWRWLAPGTPAWDDPQLWARLLETPFDDLKLRLIEQLDRRSRLPGQDGNDLTPLWTATLLNVHRGGRHKARAVRQLADAIAAHPDQADGLLAVLAVAVRSIRAPEQRAGLAAAVGLMERDEQLAARVRAAIPELSLASNA